MKILNSVVPEHEGPCTPTWLNKSAICQFQDQGVSGFFRRVKTKWGISYSTGKEFHGIIRDGVVMSTKL